MNRWLATRPLSPILTLEVEHSSIGSVGLFPLGNNWCQFYLGELVGVPADSWGAWISASLCEVLGSRFALDRGRFRRETRSDRLPAPPELPEKSGTPELVVGELVVSGNWWCQFFFSLPPIDFWGIY